MLINTKDKKILYKKLRRLLAGIFIDIELVKFLSSRKLYKLMWKMMKNNEKFCFSKQEVKILAKTITEFNFDNFKYSQATLIADFVAFIIIDKTEEKNEYAEDKMKEYVIRFYAQHPLTLE
ncbi:hypothetical protein MYMA111404_04010 [Mycoplasma marinum]|uniref:Uncharacterized protein n=1 Tax=Mycoplasma marinum TaxID=1937190 RepID=A0A4R0XT14_9MOLU|nr:hypothetical protein [Mycoplasma marinum]TCG10877.1 hypothetical protein C4B24_03635 [Mycoplasma marinum]